MTFFILLLFQKMFMELLPLWNLAFEGTSICVPRAMVTHIWFQNKFYIPFKGKESCVPFLIACLVGFGFFVCLLVCFWH